MPARILPVDDHPFLIQSLGLLLATQANCAIVGTLTHGDAVLPWLAENPVDVALLDFNVPPDNGVQRCRQIVSQYPSVRVIMLSVQDDVATVRAAVEAGAVGYLSKKVAVAELIHAIETVQRGHRYFSETILASLLHESTQKNTTDLLSTLTAKEIDVLRLVAEEMTTKEIADQMCLSVSSVEAYRKKLMEKLGVKSGVGLAAFAIRHGLV